jgi:hypothetical protein
MFSYFSWAILGVLYFLFFSAKIPDLGQGGIEVRAGWYVIDRKDGTQAPSFQGGFMLKFGHSRLMALGDFKRTWRDDKTTCGVFQVGKYVKQIFLKLWLI